MARVDVVVCSHPAANCELFMPLNRTMIVYPSTRLEFGRDDESIDWRWVSRPFASSLDVDCLQCVDGIGIIGLLAGNSPILMIEVVLDGRVG